MTKQKLFLAISVFGLFFTSCDCLQRTDGVVIDSESKLPLDSVTVSYYIESDTTNYRTKFVLTDFNGYFEFKKISGGLFRCPNFKLKISKNGYENIIKEYPACCISGDTILLKQLNIKN